LVNSLYMQMTDLRPLPTPAPINRGLIALFPNEIARSAFSEHLQSCYHDVPWDEPELVRAILNQALRTGIWRRLRTFLDHHFPVLVNLLIGLGVADRRRR
jgi:hypothetical protein